jgi:hypothetical protein
MKGNAIQQLQRLLLMAGVVMIWLSVPAMGGSLATSLDHDRDHPKLVMPSVNTRLSHPMKSESGIMFEKFIHFQKNGEAFLYESTPPEGSGAFMIEAIFWIAPDGTFHPIDFENAGLVYEHQMNEGEFLLTGGPGILFSKERLGFEFFIANNGDPRCCPTAGKISGTYKVVGEEHFDPESKEYSSTFKLIVDGYKRDIVSSEDLSGYIHKE